MPAAANAPYHARTVARLAVQRRLIAAGTRLVHLGRSTDDGDLQDVTAAAEAEVEAVASGVASEGGAVRVGDILDDYLDRLEEPEENPGIEWPCADLNRLMRPMRPGRLYVIGALSGVGKSIACWNVAAHAALRQKQRVLFHALEMSTDELMDRLIAAEAACPSAAFSAQPRRRRLGPHLQGPRTPRRRAPVRGRIGVRDPVVAAGVDPPRQARPRHRRPATDHDAAGPARPASSRWQPSRTA
jgi:replicative DNA helicase